MINQLELARLNRTDPTWPVVRIKHVGQLSGGGTPPKANDAFWSGGDVPWVSPKDMKRRLITETEDYITEAAVDGSATSYVERGAPLVVVRSGILRHTLPVALAGRRLTLNQDMKAFRLSPRLNGEFFAYWIEGQSSDLLLEWRQFGATVESIDTNRMMNGKIAVPDRATQKIIVAFLDRETARIDQLIKKKERQVALLAEKMRSALISRFDLLEAVPRRLKHLGKVKGGSGFPIGLQGERGLPLPFFKVKHLRDFGLGARLVTADDTITQGTASALGATIFPAGTVVFAKIGAALLMGRFTTLGVDACIDNNMSALIPHRSLIIPDFALLALSLVDMSFFVQPGAVPSLDTTAFLDFSIKLPSLDTQEQFVAKERAAARRHGPLARAVRTSIDKLREFRSALIISAVTGQIDATSWGKQGSTGRRLDAIQETLA